MRRRWKGTIARVKWIFGNLSGVWHWAGVWADLERATHTKASSVFPQEVEFEVPGMVEPYDRMRLIGGLMTSCGTARLAMSLHVYLKEYGGWNGGVIDHNDLRDIRDVIDRHLGIIDALPADERFRLMQNFSERRRLKDNPISANDVWPFEIDAEAKR